MSGKRFQLDIGDDYCFINDELEDRTYAIYNSIFKERWSQEIVDLLNNLAEENEQLRKKLDSFNPIMFNDMQKGTIILYSKGGIDE